MTVGQTNPPNTALSFTLPTGLTTLHNSGAPAYVVTYRFESAQPTDNIWQSFSSWTTISEASRNAIRSALAEYEQVINVDFVEAAPGNADPELSFGVVNLPDGIAGRADYRLQYSIDGGGNAFNPSIDRMVWLDIDSDRDTSTILHELGHAFTMKHPGADQGSPPFLPNAENNAKFTVMSYNVNPETSFDADHLMLYDVAALQARWGANLSTRTGDNTYGAPGRFDSPTGSAWVVWDAGGHDTIRGADGGTVNIDLRAAAYSSLDAVDDLAIGYGVTVEDAVASGGADTLTGNDAANRLAGGSGDDTMSGGAGNDTLVPDIAFAAHETTLNGNSMALDGTLELRVKFPGFFGGSQTWFKSFSSDGFRFSDITDTVFGMSTHDAEDASQSNLYYNGPNVLYVDGGSSTGHTIDVSAGSRFGAKSVELDSARFQFGSAVNFVGTRLDGSTVQQSFLLDFSEGLETFEFDPEFSGLSGLRFSGNSDFQFDNFVLVAETAGDDTLDGGAGNDTVDYSALGNVLNIQLHTSLADAGTQGGFDRFASIEHAVAGSGADQIWGNHLVNVLVGAAGNDWLHGFGANDTLYGGDGGDQVLGGDGADTLYGGDGDDFFWFDNQDAVFGGAGVDYAYATDANAVTVNLATASLEGVWANNGADFLDASGTSWSVQLIGYGVGDTLRGGSGNDYVWFDEFDTVTGGGGIDAAYATTANGVTVNYSTQGIEQVWATNGNDRLDASGTSDGAYLIAYAGTDTVLGGAGNDYMWIDWDASDTVNGGAGRDEMYQIGSGAVSLDLGARGLEAVLGSNVGDVLNGASQTQFVLAIGLAGDDTLTGGSNNDYLFGDDGADRLAGGAGNDVLLGGAGSDTFVFTSVAGGSGTDQFHDFASGDQILVSGNNVVSGLGTTTAVLTDGSTLITNNGYNWSAGDFA